MDLRTAFLQAIPDEANCGVAGPGVVALLLDRRDWSAFDADADACLDAAERGRVARKRREDDRVTTRLAYAFHRLLLASWLGCEPRDVPLFRDALGCPRLPDERLHTSLSHAAPYIAIAVSDAGPVGVDIEPVDRAPAMQEIAARVAHPLELGDMAALQPSARHAALLALWVRKEAALKAAGVGLEVEMNLFRAPVGERLHRPGPDVGPTEVRMLDAGGEILAAVAGPVGFRLAWAWSRPPR